MSLFIVTSPMTREVFMLSNKFTNKNIIASIILFSTTLLVTACQSNSNSASHEKIKKKIRENVTSTMKKDQSPGMAIALVNKDKIVFSQGFGVTNVETQQAVTADTSFWLASISKTAIAVSIMHARERGLLYLDVNVFDLLKNQAGISLNKPFKEPILLKHLVSHTSSIVDNNDFYACTAYVGDENGQHYNLYNRYLGVNTCDETLPVTLIGYLKAYLTKGQPYYSEQNNFLQEKPGARFEYSNIGAALAGYTLEVATGLSLADYAKTHIFDPLKMNNTSWRLNDLDGANIATPYVWDDDAKKLTPLPLYSFSTWPDGGLRSTANDLAKYLLMVMNKGKIDNTRILSTDSVRKMLPAADKDFGGGVFWQKVKIKTNKNERILIGHDGSEFGAYTYMQYDPEKQVGVIILANGDDKIYGYSENDQLTWSVRHYTLIDKLLDNAKDLGK